MRQFELIKEWNGIREGFLESEIAKYRENSFGATESEGALKRRADSGGLCDRGRLRTTGAILLADRSASL